MDQTSPEFFLLLLKITSSFHEKRHFFDTFGTTAGLSLFTNHQDCIERFAALCIQLARRGIPWRLPLSKWLTRYDCPGEVKQFARHLRSFKIANDIFSGNFSGMIMPGTPVDPWIDVPVYQGKKNSWTVPAFPLSLSTGELMGDGEAALAESIKNATSYTAFQPIGYKSLIEGAAHLMARCIVDGRFEGIDPQLLPRYGPYTKLSGADQNSRGLHALAELIGTYSAADLMVSRFLRQYAIPRFERASVFKLIDIALSSAELIVADAGKHSTIAAMSSPGQIFVDQLSSVGISALHKASFAYPDNVDDRYLHLLAHFKKTTQWTAIPDPESPYAASKVWRSFLSEMVVVPLLERRLESKHALFYKVETMLKDMDEAPLPHVNVINDQLRFEGVPVPVQQAWMHNMMFSELAHQIFADDPLLRCPRAHHMLPGMKSVDLMIDPSKGSCKGHIARGCGSWSATRSLPLPDCLFKLTLQAYGFIPIASVAS